MSRQVDEDYGILTDIEVKFISDEEIDHFVSYYLGVGEIDAN